MSSCRILLVFLVLVTVTGCVSLPQDENARRHVYERRLSRLEFPVTRERLYKTLHPASPAQPTGGAGSGLLTGSEFYRLDDIFVVEMSVVYKAVAGAGDYFAPSPTVSGRIRSILDATESLENFMNRGTPEHPADIIRAARILRRPLNRYDSAVSRAF